MVTASRAGATVNDQDKPSGPPAGATAADLEGLGEAVRVDVKAKTGIELEWEIKRIGRP